MDTYHRWMEVVIPAGLVGLPGRQSALRLWRPTRFADGLPTDRATASGRAAFADCASLAHRDRLAREAATDDLICNVISALPQALRDRQPRAFQAKQQPPDGWFQARTHRPASKRSRPHRLRRPYRPPHDKASRVCVDLLPRVLREYVHPDHSLSRRRMCLFHCHLPSDPRMEHVGWGRPWPVKTARHQTLGRSDRVASLRPHGCPRQTPLSIGPRSFFRNAASVSGDG